MSSIVTLLVVVAIIAGVFWLVRQQQATKARSWTTRRRTRAGGSSGSAARCSTSWARTTPRSRRWPTRPSATPPPARRSTRRAAAAQARGVTETAYEGLYYVRAARTAMDLDPGPELPRCPASSGPARSPRRATSRSGPHYGASPNPSGRNTHYYPGGMVAGRPGPARLVLRAVVASRAGRRRVGPRLGPAVHLAVQRHGRVAYADGFADGAAADGMDGGMDGGDAGGDVGDGGGDTGGDGAATTAAATSAVATSSDPPASTRDLSGPMARLSDRPGGTFPGRSALTGTPRARTRKHAQKDQQPQPFRVSAAGARMAA